MKTWQPEYLAAILTTSSGRVGPSHTRCLRRSNESNPPEEKVAELEARIATVKEEIAAKTARLKEVESQRLREIQLRLRRARYAVTAKEQKRRTRRLILMGTYVEAKMNEDPDACQRFMAALDGSHQEPGTASSSTWSLSPRTPAPILSDRPYNPIHACFRSG